jgi:hypothetical protein
VEGKKWLRGSDDWPRSLRSPGFELRRRELQGSEECGLAGGMWHRRDFTVTANIFVPRMN